MKNLNKQAAGGGGVSRQRLRTMGRILEKEMRGRVEVENPVDHARSASLFLGEKRPHSCFRNALNALYGAPWSNEDTVYVEGWLIYDVAYPDPMAHGWLEHAGKIVDGTLPILAKQVRDEHPEVVVGLRYVAIKRWTKEEHMAEEDGVLDCGMDIVHLPMLPELQDAITDDERKNPDHFKRIYARQATHDEQGAR